jgi:exopolysaccharide biosynthesis polyprenyl glycosylphosphotransferase
MISPTKNLKIWKTAAQVLVDFVFINLGVGLAYLVRFRFYQEFFDGSKRLSTQDYILFNIIFSLVAIMMVAAVGVYEINRKKTWLEQVSGLAIGIFSVIFGIVSFFFFFEFDQSLFPNGIPVSRFILLFAGFFAFISVLVGRVLFWLANRILQLFQVGVTKIVIIGDDQDLITSHFKRQTQIESVLTFEALNIEVLQTLQSKMFTREISEIYMFGDDNEALAGRLALYAERFKVSFIFAPEGFGQFQFFDLQPRRIHNTLFLEILHSNLDGWRIVFKRLFDILFAAFFLVLFNPFYILIACLIWLEDHGNPFYLSERVGPDGKFFKLWKFRRLKMEFCTTSDSKKALEYEQKLIAEKDVRGDGVLYKIQNDPRSTRIGKFIERTSLDELPQFINVLIGNMSVVGPRPHQPREVAKYQAEHYKVLNIKPGITGMAQINGRSDLPFDKEVELDCWYIENWSFVLDLVIIIKTPFALLAKRKN